MVDLPETLFVPAIGDSDNLDAVKATSPEGKSVPIAFTSMDFLDQFASATGLASKGVRAIKVATGQLLDELIASQEPEICIDPLQPTETRLSYNKAGAVRRAVLPHGSTIEVRPSPVPMPEEFLQLLREVARSLPAVDDVWLMEMVIKPESSKGEPSAEEVRPLLVVRQNVPEEDETFHDTFMEFGDRWCENLPRGIAVDMLPDFAQPVAGFLNDACRVYTRK